MANVSSNIDGFKGRLGIWSFAHFFSVCSQGTEEVLRKIRSEMERGVQETERRAKNKEYQRRCRARKTEDKKTASNEKNKDRNKLNRTRSREKEFEVQVTPVKTRKRDMRHAQRLGAELSKEIEQKSPSTSNRLSNYIRCYLKNRSVKRLQSSGAKVLSSPEGKASKASKKSLFSQDSPDEQDPELVKRRTRIVQELGNIKVDKHLKKFKSMEIRIQNLKTEFGCGTSHLARLIGVSVPFLHQLFRVRAKAKDDNKDNAQQNSKYCLSNTDKDIIASFYKRAGITMQLPHRKFFKNLFMCRTILDAYTKYKAYCSASQIEAVSLASFNRHRPDQLRLMKKLPDLTCQCLPCMNLGDYVLQLISYGVKGLSKQSNINIVATLCRDQTQNNDTEQDNTVSMYNFSIKCIKRQCKECGTKKLSKVLHDENINRIDWQRVVTYSIWVTVKKKVEGKAKPKGVLQHPTKEDTLGNLMKKFLKHMETMALHRFNMEWQADQFEAQKENLKPGDIILLCDFGTNFSVREWEEPHSKYWDRTAVTVFNVVVYYLCPHAICRQMVTDEIVVTSNDKVHDFSAVEAFTNKILLHLASQDIPVDRVIRYADNCASQFKSLRTNFVMSTKTIPVIHNFFCAHHGKSAADGVGGRCMQALERAVKTSSAEIQDAQSIADYLTRTYGTGGRLGPSLTDPQQSSKQISAEDKAHVKKFFLSDDVSLERNSVRILNDSRKQTFERYKHHCAEEGKQVKMSLDTFFRLQPSNILPKFLKTRQDQMKTSAESLDDLDEESESQQEISSPDRKSVEEIFSTESQQAKLKTEMDWTASDTPGQSKTTSPKVKKEPGTMVGTSKKLDSTGTFSVKSEIPGMSSEKAKEPPAPGSATKKQDDHLAAPIRSESGGMSSPELEKEAAATSVQSEPYKSCSENKEEKPCSLSVQSEPHLMSTKNNRKEPPRASESTDIESQNAKSPLPPPLPKMCCHRQRHFFCVNDIPRDLDTSSARSIAGTQLIHSFRNTGIPGVIEVRENTCPCPFCMEGEGKACKNEKWVGKFHRVVICEDIRGDHLKMKNTLWDPKPVNLERQKWKTRAQRQVTTQEQSVGSEEGRGGESGGESDEEDCPPTKKRFTTLKPPERRKRRKLMAGDEKPTEQPVEEEQDLGKSPTQGCQVETNDLPHSLDRAHAQSCQVQRDEEHLLVLSHCEEIAEIDSVEDLGRSIQSPPFHTSQTEWTAERNVQQDAADSSVPLSSKTPVQSPDLQQTSATNEQLTPLPCRSEYEVGVMKENSTEQSLPEKQRSPPEDSDSAVMVTRKTASWNLVMTRMRNKGIHNVFSSQIKFLEYPLFKAIENLKDWDDKVALLKDSCPLEGDDTKKPAKLTGLKKNDTVDHISRYLLINHCCTQLNDPCDIHKDLRPLYIYGDGRCLYNSFSRVLFGDSSHSQRLTVLLMKHVTENEERFLTEAFWERGLPPRDPGMFRGSLAEEYLRSSGAHCAHDPGTSHREKLVKMFRTVVSNMTKTNEIGWGGPFQMAAFADWSGHPVRCIQPVTFKNPMPDDSRLTWGFQMANRWFLPWRKDFDPQPVFVMHTMMSGAQTLNHFICLLPTRPMTFQERAESGPASSNFDRQPLLGKRSWERDVFTDEAPSSAESDNETLGAKKRKWEEHNRSKSQLQKDIFRLVLWALVARIV